MVISNVLLALVACGGEPRHRHAPPSSTTSPSLPAVGLDTGATPVTTAETGGATGDTGPPPLDCSFSPCEGNFVGTWRFGSSDCVGGTRHEVSWYPCSVDMRYTSDRVFEGTLDLRADGTYTLDVSVWTELSTYFVPPVCNPKGCAAVGAELDANCVDDGVGGCVCDSSNEVGPTVMNGEWWVDDYYAFYEPQLNIGQIYGNGSMAWGLYNWCVHDGELRLSDKFDNVWTLTPVP